MSPSTGPGQTPDDWFCCHDHGAPCYRGHLGNDAVPGYHRSPGSRILTATPTTAPKSAVRELTACFARCRVRSICNHWSNVNGAKSNQWRGYPAFRRHQAGAQQLDKDRPRTARHRRQKSSNPMRQIMATTKGKGHDIHPEQIKCYMGRHSTAY